LLKISTLFRSDLLLQFAGRAECSIRSLCAKINFLLIFSDKFCSFIGECYGQIQGNLHYFSGSLELFVNSIAVLAG